MSFTTLNYVVGLSAIATGALYFSQSAQTSSPPLPPGPPRWPIIGALFSMPKNEANWRAFLRWGQETGTSARLQKQLLDNRGVVFLTELIL